MINWKIRFKNKPFLLTFLTLLITFVYQLLAMFEVFPRISQDEVTSLVLIIINGLGAYGIVVDPTTPGTPDSTRVLTK